MGRGRPVEEHPERANGLDEVLLRAGLADHQEVGAPRDPAPPEGDLPPIPLRRGPEAVLHPVRDDAHLRAGGRVKGDEMVGRPSAGADHEVGVGRVEEGPDPVRGATPLVPLRSRLERGDLVHRRDSPAGGREREGRDGGVEHPDPAPADEGREEPLPPQGKGTLDGEDLDLELLQERGQGWRAARCDEREAVPGGPPDEGRQEARAHLLDAGRLGRVEDRDVDGNAQGAGKVEGSGSDYMERPVTPCSRVACTRRAEPHSEDGP